MRYGCGTLSADKLHTAGKPFSQYETSLQEQLHITLIQTGINELKPVVRA